MAINKGKKFEQQFQEDWEKTFPGSFCLRLPDQQSGYYGTSQNICDFICYKRPNIFLIECKSIEGNTFPLSNFTQMRKLRKYQGIPGLRCGVIVWFIDHQKVFYIPVKTFIKLEEDGKKSFNVKYEGGEDYKSYLLPSYLKRIMLNTDYSLMENLEEGE